MTKLSWGSVAERLYETGVDQGVLYVTSNNGVVWNGLVSVSESPTGGEALPYYLDGFKFLNLSAVEEFEATIEAFSAPREFDTCDGTTSLANGLYATQQPRKSFGFMYRTRIGNSVSGDIGYKLHLVYNALAAPAGRTNTTIGDSGDPMNLSWHITTLALPMTGMRPTSHIMIDSTKSDNVVLGYLEGLLHGTNSKAPRLLTPAELITLFAWNPIDIPYDINYVGDVIPSNPVNGDMYLNAGVLYVYVNGSWVSVGPPPSIS